MRRQAARFLGLFLASGFSGVALVAACGARTGLGVLEGVSPEAGPDVVEEDGFDAPSEGHFLDVLPECSTPIVCGPKPNYLYKCGVPIYQCSPLEQCVEPCGEAGSDDAGGGDACAAQCLNPCLNTLGQNTSNGCEFYAVEMDTSPDTAGACFAVFVVNQWQTGQAARLEVDYGGTTFSDSELEGFTRIPSGTGTGIVYSPFDATAGLPQNQIAVLFLSRDPNADTDPMTNDPAVLANCPPMVTPALSIDGAQHGTGTGSAFKAFHIKANVPVVAYQMLPYGGGHARVTGATLLLPTNVWGTNYVAANAYVWPDLSEQAIAGPTMAVVAKQNGTHVTINPVTAIAAGGGLAGTKAGTPVTYTLDEGEYFQISQVIELTGSAIQSDAPIAVFGGSSLLQVPLGVTRADHAEQQLPPVSALGNEYAAVRYRSRKPGTNESTRWRLVGAVNGTQLSYDPVAPPGAPSTLKQGEVAEIDDPGPWVVSSQDLSHPFYFAQYMTGGQLADLEDDASIYYGAGDPEFVNVVSPSQYLSGYTFFTDPTYPETNLVVVAVLDGPTGEFPTVTLDCAGVLGGWQPLGTKGKYQFTRIDLSTGNFQGQNGCNNGVHTIKASLTSEAAPPGDTALVGVTIWGWGSGATLAADDETSPNFTKWVSYAYPAGANITKLNSVIVPAN
jgi:IgGFc binding protein